jgi:hypothetical protein
VGSARGGLSGRIDPRTARFRRHRRHHHHHRHRDHLRRNEGWLGLIHRMRRGLDDVSSPGLGRGWSSLRCLYYRLCQCQSLSKGIWVLLTVYAVVLCPVGIFSLSRSISRECRSRMLPIVVFIASTVGVPVVVVISAVGGTTSVEWRWRGERRRCGDSRGGCSHSF